MVAWRESTVIVIIAGKKNVIVHISGKHWSLEFQIPPKVLEGDLDLEDYSVQLSLNKDLGHWRNLGLRLRLDKSKKLKSEVFFAPDADTGMGSPATPVEQCVPSERREQMTRQSRRLTSDKKYLITPDLIDLTKIPTG